MSDHDSDPDPMDKAYVQAQALLTDEAARAARRARVLGAVAAQPQATVPVAATPLRPSARWRGASWLVAASVAGLVVFVGVRLYPPAGIQPSAPAAAPPVGIITAPAPTAEANDAAIGPAPPRTPPPVARDSTPPSQTPQARRAQPNAEARSSIDAPLSASGAFMSPPAPAALAASEGASNLTASRNRAEQSALAAAPSAREAGSMAAKDALGAESPSNPAARLRAAAEAGRIAEMTALLGQDALVDAPDDKGETALMKAIRARRPAAAALLRRNGAGLDLKNRAGVSARDMARSIDDPDLNRALGLAP